MSYPVPRHWEEDRPVTFEEWLRPYGCVCMDCDAPFTSFAMVVRRMCDESMVEIAFSDEDVIPMYEIICKKCAEDAAWA